MIEFRQVTFRYPYDDYDVLDNLTFSLPDKGYATVLADAQSGKTTICKLLMGQIVAKQGEILYNGCDLQSITPLQRGILYLPKTPLLFMHRSVAYNLQYPLLVRKVDKKQACQLALSQAEKFGLLDVFNTAASKLDAQQQQTLVVARGTLRQYQTVLIDGFSDGFSSERIQWLLNVLGNDCLITTLTDNLEVALGNITVLDGGKAVFEGDKDSTAQFLPSLLWISKRKEIL